MAMNDICPHCGKSVPATALGGVCPECMLQVGLAETGQVGPGGAAFPKPARRPAPTVADLAPHFPQLELLECLGCGGMGAVYRARQPKIDRFVALKILTRTSSEVTDTEFAERFQREARALARLNHPDIVAVYDFGELGGFHYLLMEYVDGLNLRQILRSRRLDPSEALQIVPKVCAALQFAHDRGIVHRDIKPENILLDKQGRVKIADFGIAKIVGVTPETEALTGAKDIIGTPHYMAPEQIEQPHTVDHRADIYSLGVVLYEMLTGELPLGKFQPPSRKVQVDVRLDEVVLHALEKEPDRRYQRVSHLKTDVETIASSASAATQPDEGTAVVPTDGNLAGAERWRALLAGGKLARCWRTARGRRTGVVALALAVLAVMLALGRWLVPANVDLNRAPANAATGAANNSLIPEAQAPLSNAADIRFRAVPPVVTETFPESGATDVDPALTELRVSFSKTMNDSSWSWTTVTEGTSPQITAPPRYLPGDRTCVLPVKLERGKTYAIWLNSENHQGFRDQNGQPAIPYLLIFQTRK